MLRDPLHAFSRWIPRTPPALPQASDDGPEYRVKQYELVRVLGPSHAPGPKIRTDADPDVYRRFRSRMHVAGSYTGAASAVDENVQLFNREAPVELFNNLHRPRHPLSNLRVSKLKTSLHNLQSNPPRVTS